MAASGGGDPGRASADGEGLDAMAVREAARAKLFGAARAKAVTISRYVVQREIGAGGMGEVFAAFDPELARKVAIKLVHRGLGGGDADANARLLREARALAQLDHPSIVPIHDVGTHGDRIWLAMEYIDGETLRTWLATPRSRASVLGVLVRAGRGLAAAHARGILHRDFKPDNVMVAPAGANDPTSVRVTDFGLAAWADGDEQARTSPLLDERGPIDSITRNSAVLGTVGYIAPEQLAGHRPTAASDQFAFCVTAHEALCGVRPFVGRTPLEVARNTLDGVTTSAARDELPRWIRAVLRRGMARDPSERFATMDALLDALERDPAVKRRRVLLSAGVVALGGIAVGSWSSQGPTCTRDESRLGGIWDDAAKRAIETAFADTSAPYAADTWTRVEPLLDDRANEWLDARLDACLATHERGEQSPELLDLRIACLDVRREDLRELTDVLRDADAEVVRNAVTAVADLRPLAPCADVRTLRSTMAPLDDPALAGEVAAVQSELARLRANSATGRYRAALEIGERARDHAERVGHRPTFAEALLELGILRIRMGEHVDAEAELRAAVWEAEAGQHDRAAARAAAILVAIVGYGLARPDRAEEWSDQASALLERIGGDDVIEASRLNGLGLVRDVQGRFAESRELHTRALALREQALGPDHPSVSESLVNLGAIALFENDGDAAEAYFRAALANYERTLGPRHPELGGAHSNLALIAFNRGDYDASIAGNERALAVLEPAVGAESPEVLVARSNLAHAQARAGRLDEAVANGRLVVAAAARAFPIDHPEPARFQRVLGEALLRRGDAAAARDTLAAAVDVLVREGDPTAAEARIELARAMIRAGAGDAGIELARSAMTSESQRIGAEGAAALARTELDACDEERDAALRGELQRWTSVRVDSGAQ